MKRSWLYCYTVRHTIHCNTAISFAAGGHGEDLSLQMKDLAAVYLLIYIIIGNCFRCDFILFLDPHTESRFNFFDQSILPIFNYSLHH